MVLGYEKNADGVVFLTMDRTDKKTNLLGPELMAALAENLERLETEDDLKGVILTSAKKDFVAGADLGHAL